MERLYLWAILMSVCFQELRWRFPAWIVYQLRNRRRRP
jgi:hypothetical protein